MNDYIKFLTELLGILTKMPVNRFYAIVAIIVYALSLWQADKLVLIIQAF